ncbi:hypothetical protein [Qipengyuania sp. JC766]|uniref:helix-turn-helix transcriptional regulator n=1 Tax=Qipengyuania sp. JC766 TaxID=3232139 RepID=UPI00345A8EBB
MDSDELFSILGVVFPNRARAILAGGKMEGVSGGYSVGTLQEVGTAIARNCPLHPDFESDVSSGTEFASVTRLAILPGGPPMIVRYVHLPHRSGTACRVVALTCGPSDMIGELPVPSADPLPLTDQQMNLALDLVAGRSLQEIARARQCSIHTVRNQLKSALRATQAHSQGQLVTLVRDWLL